MDGEDIVDQFGGPVKPIKINEISGLLEYLQSIDWTEPWFCGLGIFHVLCAILTVLTRKTGVIQSVYFGALIMLVLCAEYINQWAAANWSLFSKQQYFDSNGLFISVVFSVPLLMNCLVIVVSWLWDVGLLISNVKQLKIRQQTKIAQRKKNRDAADPSTSAGDTEHVGDASESTESKTKLVERKKNRDAADPSTSADDTERVDDDSERVGEASQSTESKKDK